MKNFFYLSLFILLIGCSPKSGVYWCGDHPCINKKEKEAYFKKNMIVELRPKENRTAEEESAINKIIEQAKINEKERIKNEKNLLKQAKIDEKKRLKEEKEYKKKEKSENKNSKKKKNLDQEQAELIKEIEEENSLLKEKKYSNENLTYNKQNSLDSNNSVKQSNETKSFNEIVKKIREKNSTSGYPDINNIPN